MTARPRWIGFVRFLIRLSVGHFRRHRLEGALCLAGVALGVAVAIAIDSAVQASVASFGGAVDSLAERSTHSIVNPDGEITDRQYLQLLQRKLPYSMAPVIERGVLAGDDRANLISGDVNPDGTDGVGANGIDANTIVARLLGVDIFSERSLRSITHLQNQLNAAELRNFLTRPGEVVLVDQLAAALALKTGDSLRLTIGSARVTVQVAGIIQPTGVARSQLNDLILCDIATAQELTDSIGQIDRIDANLAEAADAAKLSAALPAGLQLYSTEQRSSSLNELIGSYRLNLNALSLMASFVAVFIVYNSMLISVQQREKSLGILRGLGASRMQLGALYVTEAVVFSIFGGLLGVLGGWALSRLLVGYVATTINDLYAAVRPSPVAITGASFAKGFALSTFSCLMGATVPLLRASRTPPINALRATGRGVSKGAARGLVAVGILMIAASIGVYYLPGDSPIAGFIMAMLVAIGSALVCPWLVSAVCRVIMRIVRPLQLLPLQMAAGGIARSLGITGVAVAATMLALAMNVGVRTMVSSFRSSLSVWVDRRFAADVFVGPELLVNHKIDSTLDPRVAEWVASQPEVKQIIRYRSREIELSGKPSLVVATDVPATLAETSFPIKQSLQADRAFNSQSDLLISEPLAGRLKLGVDQSLTLPTPTGPRTWTVYAIYYDFGSERGQAMLDFPTYSAAWQDDRATSLHVQLLPGFNPEEVSARWMPLLRARFPVMVNSFAHVKAEIMEIFDRTFKVTEVLTWLAGGVAFCGMAGSLLAVALARRKDYGVLAAIGMSARQTAAWVFAQGVIIAVVSAVVAAVSGTALAFVLADVIQYRSFGWSIPTHPQPRYWLECLALAIVAAVVAAIYPIHRLRKTPPAATLRQE